MDPYGAPAGHVRPPPARRRRWPWVLLGVVIVLVVLLVVADRVALHIAESKAASSLQSSQGLKQKPDVSVAGFPFLTQLADRQFDEITISAKNIDVGTDRTLNIADVTVHLHDVTVDGKYSSVRANTATADARIGYSALSRTLGVAVSDGGNGRLVAQPTVTVLGQKFTGKVSAVVHASSDAGISFDDPKVTALGITLPDIVSRALAAVFEHVISLKGLPFNVQVDGVGVTSSGLVLHLSGRDLVYTKSS